VANEASITASLSIRTGNINDRHSYSFRADVAGAIGPVPGAFEVSTSGTDCDLARLTAPGLAVMKNLDGENYVLWGVRDLTDGNFRPVGKLLPGEGFPLRLAGVDLGAEATGTGTQYGDSVLHFQAVGGPAVVYVGAYEQ
jgi:hypothetical protein